MTLLLLLLSATFACKQPLFDKLERDAPVADRTPQPPLNRDTTRARIKVHATAIVFPDSVDWRAGDTRAAKLVLFQNENALGSLPIEGHPDPDKHRFQDGHLWTFSGDGSRTTISCDGSPLFTYAGEETLVGFLVADGKVHTLGQHAGGGFCYRVDGQEVFSSALGTVLGTSARPEREGGTLTLDGSDICYAYALPVQGADDESLWEYRVMRGAELLKTIPAISGVKLYDILVHQGEVFRLEYRYGQVCLLKGETLTPLGLPEGSRSLRLVSVDGEILVKGCHDEGWDSYYWMRDADSLRYQYYARWRHLYDIYADKGEMAAVEMDLDDCVVKVVRGAMEVKLDWETYRLHTSRCVAYRNGIIALAFTGDVDYNENTLLINEELIPVPFNGYFTSIYID